MKSIFCLVWAALVASVLATGFYQNTDVYELAPDSFDEVVLGTNYTSIVEFYAPWCGHCNKFKGAYKKAGKLLKDLVNVAAVNCDLEINKPLCARYQVQGFPTVMVFRPPKYSPKRPPQSKAEAKVAFGSENYQGERSSKGLVEFSQSRVKSYVKRIFDTNVLHKFLNSDKSRVKVILLTDAKKKPSLFLKSLAIDYLGIADFAYFDAKGSYPEETILESIGLKPSEVAKPMFLVYSSETGIQEPKIIKGHLSKEKIADYMSTNFGITPHEGPGSKRFKLLSLLKKGNTLKQAKKAVKKTDKQSKKKQEVHDEL